MKKILIVIVALLLVVAGVYYYLRFHLLKAKDFKPDVSKQKSALDLRPAIIAKLQQLVKDGSDSLYILSIGKLEPDVLNSKIDATDVTMQIDTAAYKRLDKEKQLPDDVFRITFKALHIDKIGIHNLLHAKRVAAGTISVTDPVIEVYHKLQPYNKAKRAATDTLPLYKRLTGDMEQITISTVAIEHGTFINHNLAKKDDVMPIKDITIHMDDIRIDSSTQYATDRFLFAKHAAFEAKNYSLLSKDSQYVFKLGSVSIEGEQHRVTATDVQMLPNGGKATFMSKHKTRVTMYELKAGSITLLNINWWAMINKEELIASEIDVTDTKAYIYLDRTLPKSGAPIRIDNFPQQLILGSPVPFSVPDIKVHNMTVAYEEVNPDVKKSGTIIFDKINGTATRLTNIQKEVRKNKAAIINATCLFMNRVPMSGKFQLSLPKQKHGAFIADVEMGEMDHSIINPFAEPMALIRMSSGKLEKAVAHAEGNNYVVKGTVAAAYSDLGVMLLKKDSVDGHPKRKQVLDFIANTFIIKKNNPGINGKLRQKEFSLNREQYPNFFNFVWSAIKKGLLQLIGVPPALDKLH